MADLKRHSATDQCLVVSVRPNNGGGTSKNSSFCRMPSCNHVNLLGRLFVRRSFSKCPRVVRVFRRTAVAGQINNRPMKSLRSRTPAEMVVQHIRRLHGGVAVENQTSKDIEPRLHRGQGS